MFLPNPPQKSYLLQNQRQEWKKVWSKVLPPSALSLTGKICALPKVLHLHESRGKGGREHMNFTESGDINKNDSSTNIHLIFRFLTLVPFYRRSAPLLFWSPPFQMHLSPFSWTRKAQKSLNCVGMLCSMLCSIKHR